MHRDVTMSPFSILKYDAYSADKKLQSLRSSPLATGNNVLVFEREEQKKRPMLPPFSLRCLDSLPTGRQWQKWPS